MSFVCFEQNHSFYHVSVHFLPWVKIFGIKQKFTTDLFLYYFSCLSCARNWSLKWSLEWQQHHMTENTREHLLRQGHLQKMSLLPAGCCILHKSYTPLRLIICMFYHSDFLGLSFPSGIKWLHIDLPSPVTSTTGCCFCFGSVPSFFLESVLHGSPVAYWAPTDLGSFSFSVLSFAFSYCSWGSQGKNTEVVCHSLLQWTFCWNSPP